MNPQEYLVVSLPAEQWNAVLNSLAEAPFRMAAPLIQEIQRQCMQQGQPAGDSGATLARLRGNGEIRGEAYGK